jgi:hypothetical protein
MLSIASRAAIVEIAMNLLESRIDGRFSVQSHELRLQ